MKYASWRLGVILGVAGLAASASAGVVSGTIVVKAGDPIDGSTASTLNAPHTNGLGQVGTVIALADGRRAIWIGNGVVFTSDEALPDALTGGEGTMGIGNAGEFIYSPAFNGDDAVYGDGGLVAVEGTPAPDFTAGFETTFHSRPRMIDDGTSYWISGTNDGAGGGITQNRIVYSQAPDGTITGILRAGDVVDGVTIAGAGGIDFDAAISDDGAHRLFIFNDANAGGTSDDTCLSVDGTIVAREALPNGDGDNWDNFDATSINNSGDYVFSGDTDGDTALDEFIAYNGAIQLREGGVLAGGLMLDGSVDALSLNHNGQAAFIWDIDDAGGDIETLFYASDASDMGGTAVPLLSVGDAVDTDGDGIADWTMADFNASVISGPGVDLAEDGSIYIEVDLTPIAGGDDVEVILCILIPVEPCNAADLAPDFGVLDLADINAFVGGFGTDPISDLNGDEIWDLIDINLFVTAFLAGCP